MCDLSPFAVVGSNTIIQVSNIITCVSGGNNDGGQMKKSETPFTGLLICVKLFRMEAGKKLGAGVTRGER